MYDPPEGRPGQHVYTFVISILSKSPQFQFSLSATALGIYLFALYNEMLVPQVMYIHTE
jgi:hypothetical protein